MVAEIERTYDFDVLNLFQIHIMQFPMLKRFAYIIKSIIPFQPNNKIDFSLAGIYTESCRANLSVEILSDLTFINRNSSALGCNTTIDVFEG